MRKVFILLSVTRDLMCGTYTTASRLVSTCQFSLFHARILSTHTCAPPILALYLHIISRPLHVFLVIITTPRLDLILPLIPLTCLVFPVLLPIFVSFAKRCLICCVMCHVPRSMSVNSFDAFSPVEIVGLST